MTVPPGWHEAGGALERELEFATFAESIAFVTRLAELAELENHHPDIAIHYRRVVVRWWTHTAGGITPKDEAMAARTSELA